MANDTLIFYQASIFSNILPGGDGVIVWMIPLSNGGNQTLLHCLVLTDMGHYLFPTDGLGVERATEEHKKIKKAVCDHI